MKAMKSSHPDTRFVGIGGPRMRKEGLECFMEAEKLCVIGLVEVFKNLPFFIKTLSDMGDKMKEEHVDAFIPVDFPDFNLALCKKAKKAGIPVIYYICPQVWAWRKSRIPKIEKLVDLMLTIFPFEVDCFDANKLKTQYVGHPLIDEVPIAPVTPAPEKSTGKVVLMPGSRKSEIEHHMPTLVPFINAFHKKHPSVTFLIPCAETLTPGTLTACFGQHLPANVKIVEPGKSTELLQSSDAALIASGTSTLQGVLCNIPLCLFYRLHPFTFWLGTKIIKLPHVGLVNLVAKKEVSKEFLQHDMNVDHLTRETEKLLWDETYRQRMLAEYANIQNTLGGEGASKRAAEAIFSHTETT